MTRRSTGLMPSSRRITAAWSTRPGRGNPVTRLRSSGRCPISGTRSGGAGSSPASSRCRPRRCGGAPRWPGSGRAVRWTAPPRPRCSPQLSKTGSRRCRYRRSCWRSGRGARSAPTSTSRSAGRCTRCRGATSARPWMPGPPRRWCSCSQAGTWSRPMPASRRASRPTWPTTRRRRSRSICAPRRGAASKPPASAGLRRAARGQRLVSSARRPGRAAPG